MDSVIPVSFRAELAERPADPVGGIDGDTWLRGLPGRIAGRLEAWQLELDGPARHGACAIVLPVRRHGGEAAALKVSWPHAEAAHEHLALRAWDGRGAVRLLAADPADSALLLERLDGDRDLARVEILEACEELGGLLRSLDRPAPPRIDTLGAQTGRWREALARPVPTVPRRLQQQAASHLEDLRETDGRRLVHTDLHFRNALAPLDAARGSWLAIDPKPLAGEWAFAVAPAVWNRSEEAARASSPSLHVRTRADIIAEVAGLDEDRVRMWTFVRLVLNAVDAAGHGSGADGFRARMIALAKAFATP